MTGAELVALIAVIGTSLSGCLTTLFHSRCSKIKCCGVECDREVINSKEEEENQQLTK
tara:strand:+ start:44 stop:217 length:174 start_codon:yes stop_codon:yes gene_type:complete